MIPLGSTVQITEDEVLKSLASKNFPLHPFADKDSPFFPDKCLGAGLRQVGREDSTRIR
jgi:hypothetical protein